MGACGAIGVALVIVGVGTYSFWHIERRASPRPHRPRQTAVLAARSSSTKPFSRFSFLASKSNKKTTPTPSVVTAGQAHQVKATIFWTGEEATADNGYIANSPSAWDEHWKDHFGGYDDPNHRNGFLPQAFTPKENPFYFALPYSDFTNAGVRRATAAQCSAITGNNNPSYSWCKNAWIMVRYGDRTVYAQWEDVGPYEEDDTAYVFGTAAPRNSFGTHAGLDVSPAVRDYLKIPDVATVTWQFVAANSVPAGPWTQTITTNPGDKF